MGRLFLLGAAFSAPLSKSASSILMGLSGLVLLWGILRGRIGLGGLFRDPLFWAVLAFSGLHFLGLLWSEDLRSGLTVSRRISYILAFYLLCGAFLRGPGDGLRVLKAVVLGTALLDLLALGKFLGVGTGRPWALPAAVLMNPIWFGNCSAVALYGSLFLVIEGLEGGKGIRSPWVATALLNLAGVLLSNSRGPYAATGVVLLLVLVPLLWRWKVGKGIAVGVLALLALLPLHPAFHGKVRAAWSDVQGFLREGRVETSVGARLGMWTLCLEVFRDHPLLGAGTGDYEGEVARRTEGRWTFLRKYNQPHSIYFYALALHGAVGLGLLLALFALTIREGLRAKKEGGGARYLGSWALAVSVHYLFGGMSETLLKIHVLVSLLGLVLGSAFAWRTGVGRGPQRG